MQWTKVEDQVPPLGETILLAQAVEGEGEDVFRVQNLSDLGYTLSGFNLVTVYRPFDQDSKYNPDYYYFSEIGTSDSGMPEVMTGDLTNDLYWMAITKPSYQNP